jgi:hypothetical protein
MTSVIEAYRLNNLTCFFSWRWVGQTQALMPTYVSILRIPQMIWVWRATVEWYTIFFWVVATWSLAQIFTYFMLALVFWLQCEHVGIWRWQPSGIWRHVVSKKYIEVSEERAASIIRSMSQTTRRHIPEGSHVHTLQRENVKCHLVEPPPLPRKKLLFWGGWARLLAAASEEGWVSRFWRDEACNHKSASSLSMPRSQNIMNELIMLKLSKLLKLLHTNIWSITKYLHETRAMTWVHFMKWSLMMTRLVETRSSTWQISESGTVMYKSNVKYY